MSNNFQYPSVTVRELRSGVPQIRGVPTSVGGFVGRCLRGPVATPIRIGSFAQFVRIFGSYSPNSYLAENVRAFFDNGGFVCYVIRVLGSSGGVNAKASVNLYSTTGSAATPAVQQSNTGAFPVELLPGETLVESVNGGGTVTATITATAAAVTGSGATYAAVTASHTLVVGVGGYPNQTVTFAGTENTQALFLTAINNALTGVVAVNSGGQIKFETEQRGSGATGSIVSASSDVLASLGLTVGAFTAGTGNVANVDAVKASELATIINAVPFTGATAVGNDTTGQLTITTTSTGSSASLQFSAGSIVSAVSGFSTTEVTGANTSSVEVMTFTTVGEGLDNNSYSVLTSLNNATLGVGLTTQVNAGSVSSVALSSSVIARMTIGDTINITDSTTTTTIRQVVAAINNNTVVFQAATTASGNLTVANAVITLETWNFSVLYNGTVVQGPVTGLRMSSLSQQNYFVTVLGQAMTGTLGLNSIDPENLVNATDLAVALGSTNVDLRPTNINTSGTGDMLTGGTEAASFADLDYIGQNASLPYTGIYATQGLKDLRMLAIPGITGSTPGFVSKTLVQYAETRGSFIAIITAPSGTTPTNCATYKQNDIGTSSYGLFYYPWVQIVSPLYGVPAISPPEGYVMGMIAKTASTYGTQQAPAGEFVGQLVDTIDVERVLMDTDKALLYPLNINPIEDILDVGQCVMGDRTMDFPGGDYQQAHIRITMIYLEQSIKTGTRFILFQPNTPATQASVQRSISNFLEGEWNRGTLTGNTIKDAFTVICDDTNNPPVIVNAQQMVCAVYVNIPQTVENLLITIQQQTSS